MVCGCVGGRGFGSSLLLPPLIERITITSPSLDGIDYTADGAREKLKTTGYGMSPTTASWVPISCGNAAERLSFA